MSAAADFSDIVIVIIVGVVAIPTGMRPCKSCVKPLKQKSKIYKRIITQFTCTYRGAHVQVASPPREVSLFSTLSKVLSDWNSISSVCYCAM